MNDTAANGRGVELLWYLPLLLWRWLARLSLLLLTAAPLALPAVAIVVLLVEFESVNKLLDGFADGGNQVSQGVAVLVAVGLLASIAKAVTVFAYDQLVSILKAVWAIVACKNGSRLSTSTRAERTQSALSPRFRRRPRRQA